MAFIADTAEVTLHSTRKPVANESVILNKFSREITQNAERGGAQAMLHGAGLTVEDLEKPQVGISSVWWEGNPCNSHLLDLGRDVKEGCRTAGLIGLQFNTIGISDAITMGGQGMRFSLPSRDIIADSIESVTIGQSYDANVSIVGCDKNPPGALMAAMRHNRPTILVWGGTSGYRRCFLVLADDTRTDVGQCCFALDCSAPFSYARLPPARYTPYEPQKW